MASTASLLSVLKFKNLIAQLNDNEFVSFLTEFSKSIGREEIVQLLCTRFVGSKNLNLQTSNQNVNGMKESKQNGVHPLTAMSNIASHIIRSRDSSNNPPSLLTINDLPCSMVGEVASYLDQTSYAALSETNRKLFVDTNSPNRLVEIDLIEMNNDATVPLQRFKRVRYLSFRLHAINQMQALDGARFSGLNQLRRLVIFGNGWTTNDLNEFITESGPCFGSVSSLVLFNFKRTHNARLSAGGLLQILSKFGGLSHLKLFDVHGSGALNSNQLDAVCPNVTHLELITVTSRWMAPIAESLSSKVDSLSVIALLQNGLNVSIWNFKKLKRLCLGAMDIECINSLLNISKSLREIAWIPNIITPPIPVLDGQRVQGVMKQLIVDQPLLEYLYVSTRGHFEEICNGIHRGLFVTKERERGQFEVALNVDVREITNGTEFICSISKIIQVLGICDIKEWMISVDGNWGAMGPQVFDWEPMGTALNGVLSQRVQLRRSNAHSFAILNDCKMKRHSKWWDKSQRVAFY